MAIGDKYATTAELKARLSVGDSTDDTRLGEALDTASRAVERYCRRQFNLESSASARSYYPTSCELVMVDDFYTSTGLIVATDEGDDGTFEVTWATTDYQLEPLNGVHDGATGWPYWRIRAVDRYGFTDGRRATVQITAKWGWSAVPAPVKEATLALAEEIFKMKDAPFGVAGWGEFGAIRVRQNMKINDMLNPYRRRALRVGG